MKLGVAKNKKKILVSGYNNSLVIHPMWLRERVTDAKYLDKNNGQRLYDPSKIKKNIKIERALIKNKFLNIKFVFKLTRGPPVFRGVAKANCG